MDGYFKITRKGGYVDVENPLIMLQNGSASHILAYGSAYIKSGKVNYINSKEAVSDCVDYSTLDCMYKKKRFNPGYRFAFF